MNKRDSSGLRPLVLIAGPTASGKSALALALAEQTGGIVVNADSAQVYRDLRILTARPSREDEARGEHRLFGHVDGAHACDAASWGRDARATIGEAHAQRRLPILVGGSGLYIRTLLEGIAPVPSIDPAVRAEVRAMPTVEAHAALARADPAAARLLAAADTSRVARALEVVRSTGRPIAEWRTRREGGIAGHIRLVARVILPARDLVYARCDARFAAMVRNGAAEEVEALLARGLDPRLPVMRAIGLREIAARMRGELGQEAMLAAGATATRQYAKRQLTWLRHQAPSAWPILCEDIGGEVVTKLRDEALTS